MDILLAHGYFLHEDPHERYIMKPYPPLGLLYLSAYLRARGFDVEIFDATFATKQEFEEMLDRRRPGIIGLASNLMTKINVLEMMRSAKQRGSTVVVGGPDPPYYAEEYLRHGADVVVIGEGEQTLAELIPALQREETPQLGSIAGLAFLDADGVLQRTPPRPHLPDLDALPLPDRERINLQQYLQTWRRHHGMSSVSLITARGCPYRCTWCSHSVFGNSLRKRSPQAVADEVELIMQQYRPDMLWYADDVFNINHKWLFAFAEEIGRRGLHVPFECICRADRLNARVIETLRGMECFRMWLGSESGSQRLLDAMQRGVKAEQVQAMTRLARRHGIETGMFLMWGYEDETAADIAQTIEHVKKANPDLVLTTVSYPIRGTEYYRRLQEQSVLQQRLPWDRSSDRDYKVRGRHSQRYYDFANKWLFSEKALAQMQERGNGTWLARAKATFGKHLGRWGMRLTAYQREA